MGVLQESIASVEESTNGIMDAVGKLPEEAIRWKPTPEVWSIHEILCHVDEAIPYWAEEIERVVAKPGVEWGRNHQNETRLAAVAVSSQRKTGDVLASIQKGSQKTVAILRKLKDEDLNIESPSRNPRFATKPMSFVLDHLVVTHLRNHFGQVRRNIEQLSAANPQSAQVQK
jgi:uncharacterized damage-inducible protein DinB